MKRILLFPVVVIFILVSGQVTTSQTCTLEWQRSDTISPIDGGVTFTIDDNENAYIAYQRSGLLGILKFDPDGNMIWDTSRVESKHVIRDISLDTAGNIFLSGYTFVFSNGGVQGTGIWLMKFDGNGNFQWKRSDFGSMGSTAYPPLCKHRIDATGNIYVVGRTKNATFDYRILKYDNNGTLLWGRSSGGSLNSDYEVAMDLSADGKVAVTGGGFGGAFYTVVYDALGTKIWDAYEYAASGASDVKFDAAGNVIAVGSKWDVNTSMDFLVLTYSTTGNLISTQTYDGNGGWEAARRFQIDPQGNYIISGIQSGGYTNWLTMKVGPTGVVYWISLYDSTTANEELPYDLAMDEIGNAYITGIAGPQYAAIPFYRLSMVTVKYDNSSGSELCINLNQTNSSTGIKVIPVNSSVFYVLGRSSRDFLKVNSGGGGPTCNWSMIDFNDFESGWGIWNDGGSDARRNANDAAWANSGSFCVRLIDNTASSVMTTNVLDLSNYNEISVALSYYVRSFEGAEDFWLQLSSDGGITFTTFKEWTLGVEFQNDQRKFDAVTLTGPFSANSVFRFRCDASANNDMVYIDDVIISGCAAISIVTLTTNVIGQGSISPASGTFNAGSSVSLSATPDPGWQFDGWSGGTSGTDNPVTIVLNSNKVITATFSEITSGCSWAVLNNQDFESGWGIWNKGGSDARRSINDATYANSGSFCVRLRDNTSTSVITTNGYNLSLYEEIKVDFSYYVRSFEGVEDFWLQISNDGGATFTTVKAWTVGIDFQNDERKFDAVTLTGPFGNSIALRFRCDASANNDGVYIDDVIISGCSSSGAKNLPETIIGQLQNDAPNNVNTGLHVGPKLDLNLFPNPARDQLRVEFVLPEITELSMRIIDLTGKLLQHKQWTGGAGEQNVKLDIGQLKQGTYVLQLMTKTASASKKFIVIE